MTECWLNADQCDNEGLPVVLSPGQLDGESCYLPGPLLLPRLQAFLTDGLCHTLLPPPVTLVPPAQIIQQSSPCECSLLRTRLDSFLCTLHLSLMQAHFKRGNKVHWRTLKCCTYQIKCTFPLCHSRSVKGNQVAVPFHNYLLHALCMTHAAQFFLLWSASLSLSSLTMVSVSCFRNNTFCSSVSSSFFFLQDKCHSLLEQWEQCGFPFSCFLNDALKCRNV